MCLYFLTNWLPISTVFDAIVRNAVIIEELYVYRFIQSIYQMVSIEEKNMEKIEMKHVLFSLGFISNKTHNGKNKVGIFFIF